MQAVELHKWRIEEEKRLEEGNAQPAPMAMSSLRCRRYTLDEIEQATEHFSESRKIGEGSYGPVYKCYLDHTRTAVKVLRPDAAQGREQFEREVSAQWHSIRKICIQKGKSTDFYLPISFCMYE